jgi:hypothetical protein
MSKWAEGRVLSKKCWSLLGKNKYFLWFPVLGLVLSMIPIVIFGIATIGLLANDSEVLAIITAAIGLVFVNYSFTLSGAALVSAADAELAGKDVSVGYGFGKAFGKLIPLFAWALIRAAVGALFAAMRGNGSGAAGIAGSIFAALGAAAWSIVTFFVTPYIMFHDSNAIAAIKESAKLVKEKWGTQVTGGIRIGASVVLIIIPSVLLIVFGVILFTVDILGRSVSVCYRCWRYLTIYCRRVARSSACQGVMRGGRFLEKLRSSQVVHVEWVRPIAQR